MADPQKVTLPFIWPAHGSRESHWELTSWYTVLEWAPNSIRSISGMVSGVDDLGVEFLSSLLSENPAAICQILLLLSPATSTDSRILMELLELQEALAGRLQLRVDTTDGESTTTLCLVKATSHDVLLLTGSSPNFLLASGITPTFLLQAEAALISAWKDWFGAVWADGVPLTVEVTRLPNLIPAPGDPRAAQLWKEYERVLGELKRSQAQQNPAVEGTSAPDAEVNGVQEEARGSTGNPTDGADPLGLDISALQKRLRELYAKGRLLTVDQTGRVPTLDCPVRPELLGWSRDRLVGTIKHRSEFRIPLLDAEERKQFEKLRQQLTAILPRFTFLLGDRVRWIPLGAVSLLEREMAKIDEDGQKHLSAILKGDVDEFLARKRGKIEESAQKLLKEQDPEGTLSDQSLSKILDTVRKRVEAAKLGQFAPKVTLTSVQAPDLIEVGHISGWGQALKFLYEIATYPRKALTISSFTKDLVTTIDQLRAAMNVLHDPIWGDPYWAEQELSLIELAMAEDVEASQKCEWLLAMIDGKSNDVADALQTRDQERSGTDR